MTARGETRRRPSRRLDFAGERAEQRRLAAAVRTADEYPFAVCYREVKRSERPLAALQDDSFQRDDPGAATLSGREPQTEGRALPRSVGNVDAAGTRADLACTCGHSLGAHLHPLAGLFVVVVNAAVGMFDARRRTSACLPLGRDQLIAACERVLTLGTRPLPRRVALALERVPAASILRRLSAVAVQFDDLADCFGEQGSVVGDEHHAPRTRAKQHRESL